MKCDCEKGYCVEWKIEQREHAVCSKCGYTQAEIRANQLQAENAKLKEEAVKHDNVLRGGYQLLTKAKAPTG